MGNSCQMVLGDAVENWQGICIDVNLKKLSLYITLNPLRKIPFWFTFCLHNKDQGLGVQWLQVKPNSVFNKHTQQQVKNSICHTYYIF